MEIILARKAYFSSGIQLKREDWTDAQNESVYGRESTNFAIGHNYQVEAYLIGEIDSQTGMVMNLTDFDQHLKKTLEQVDHRFLNAEVPEFKDVLPTLPRLARYFFIKLKAALQGSRAKLLKVRIYQGDDQWVDDFGDS
jgi:6-pyruvoyltetrahydropterin/6-carboxytetrahydropterin synthase